MFKHTIRGDQLTTHYTIAAVVAQGALRPATDIDVAEILRRIGAEAMRDYFLDIAASEILVSDGDVVIDGGWTAVGPIAVFGNLTVNGFYKDDDDGGDSAGAICVFGDMAVHDVYSVGAINVTGNLNVRGFVLTVYDDFLLFVGGVVNARGLISHNKFAIYEKGKLPFAFDSFVPIVEERVEQEAAWQTLLPQLFTSVYALGSYDFFDRYNRSNFVGLGFDIGAAANLLDAGQSVWREKPSVGIPTWEMVVEILDAATTEARLAYLMKADLMLAQLIAARPAKSEALIAALAQIQDPVINSWLSKP